MSEPTILTPAMSSFLETIRDTGSINMMGAAPYLERDFDLSRRDAKTALMEWMDSFEDYDE